MLAAALHIWEFDPRGLANITWALATLAVKVSEMLYALGSAAVHTIGEFNAQNLANSCWAFVTRAGEDSVYGLREAVQVAAAYRSREFKTQILANTAVAFATLDVGGLNC